jgi:hypothetical protein
VPNETTARMVVVPETKIGPPESPKQVPPVLALLENFADVAHAGAEDTLEVDQLQLCAPPRVSTERGLRSGALQAVADRGVELLLVLRVELVEQALGRQLPYSGTFTGSLSTSTPGSRSGRRTGLPGRLRRGWPRRRGQVMLLLVGRRAWSRALAATWHRRVCPH